MWPAGQSTGKVGCDIQNLLENKPGGQWWNSTGRLLYVRQPATGANVDPNPSWNVIWQPGQRAEKAGSLGTRVFVSVCTICICFGCRAGQEDTHLNEIDWASAEGDVPELFLIILSRKNKSTVRCSCEITVHSCVFQTHLVERDWDQLFFLNLSGGEGRDHTLVLMRACVRVCERGDKACVQSVPVDVKAPLFLNLAPPLSSFSSSSLLFGKQTALYGATVSGWGYVIGLGFSVCILIKH